MKGAIYRKYRPQTFAEVTNQNHIKITVQNQITNGTVAHAYLFSGPRGVGKTTIARLLAKAVNCENRKEGEAEPCGKCTNCLELAAGNALDVVEIDAASHTGVDNVRENIIESVRFAPSKGKMKVFIIDEVHMLSTSAFNALLKTLEEPPAHALFILATTEIHKIPQTILSRCQRFDFKRIPTPEIIKRLETIAKEEGMSVDEEVMRSIARLSEGCLRDAESLFGQILALGEKKIGVEEASIILPVTNTATVVDILGAASRRDVRVILDVLNQFVDQGGSVKHLHDELIDATRTLMLLALDGPYHDHYDTQTMDAMRGMLERLNVQDVSKLLDMLLFAKTKPAPDTLPHLPLELVFVPFCAEGVPVEAPPAKKVAPAPAPVSEPTPAAEASVPDPEPAAVPEPEPESTPEPVPSGEMFTVEDIASKWGRVCEAVKKRNIALPLVLGDAKPLKIEDKEMTLGFEHRFHFDTFNEQKNIAVLEEAIVEIMQTKVHVKAQIIEDENEKALTDIANAFGGEVQN